MAFDNEFAEPSNQTGLSVDITDKEQLESGGLSIDLGMNIPSVDPQIAASRAFRANFGLKALGKTEDEYKQSFVNGQEENVRKEASSSVDMRKAEVTKEALANVARRKNGPLAPEEIDYVKNIVQGSAKTDPSTVFETSYGREYANYLDKAYGADRTFWKDAQAEIPEVVSRAKEAVSTAVAKTEYLRTQAQNLEEEAKTQGWVPFIADVAKQAIPGYYEAKVRGNIPGVGLLEGGLAGENIEAQSRELYRMPLDKIKEIYPAILDNLKKNNPSLAADFARKMVEMSSDDKTASNIFSVLDIIGVGQAARGIYSVGKKIRIRPTGIKPTPREVELTKQVEEASIDMVKNNGKWEMPTKATVAEAAGDLEEAAVQKAVANAADKTKGVEPTPRTIIEDLPSAFRVDLEDIRSNPGRGGQELVIRIEQQSAKTEQALDRALTNAPKVQLLPALADEASIRTLMSKANDLFPGLDNRILNIEYVNYHPQTNSHTVDLILGDAGAKYFNNMKPAHDFAKRQGLVGYRVERDGLGYFIRLKGKALDQTNDIIRDLHLSTANSVDPEGFLTSFISKLRNPDEILSNEHTANRKVATYTPSVIMQVMEEEAKNIRRLAKGATKVDPVTGRTVERLSSPIATKTRFKDFERVLKVAKTMPDEKGEMGYFFKSPGELEDFYQTHFKRLPDNIEIEAYFSYKRLHEVDRVLRNAAIIKAKRRVGTESHSISIDPPAGSNSGERINLEWFDGVRRKSLPTTKDNILIFGKGQGDEKVVAAEKIGTKRLKELRKDVEEGRKVVLELYSPEERPFQSFGDVVGGRRIRYAIVDTGNVVSRPISLDQLPRRGGGHFEFDYPQYIKQAKMRPERIGDTYRAWYEGDTTIMPMSNRGLAKQVATHLDEVRSLLRREKFDEAKAYVDQHLSDIGYKEIKSWFDPRMVNGKLELSRLSLKEKIVVIDKNATVGGTSKELERSYKNPRTGASTFVDGTKHGSLARAQQVAFTSERDTWQSMTVNNIGSKNNPVYSYEPSKYVDPIPTMNRALAKITHSTWLDDYKAYAVDRWLERASIHLQPKDSELRASPMYWFQRADKEFRTDVSAADKARLMAQHFQIQQFLGIPSKLDNVLESISQKTAEMVYGVAGPKGPNILPINKLFTSIHPGQFLKSMAFTYKLGMFNVGQLMVQSNTYSLIYGHSPRHAVGGSAAALMTIWSRVNKNPAIIDGMDDMLSKLQIPGLPSWKKGYFKESLQLAEDTGFFNVQNEHALKNNPMSQNVVKTAGREFFDAGEVFFRWGEKNGRFGGWHTAYLEFRTKNPTGRLTEKDKLGILERADELTNNMSRASSSIIHTGPITALPTQFMAYQLRLTEQMVGKKMDWATRARIIAMQAALYGVPLTAGLTSLPIPDYVRQKALEGTLPFQTGPYVMGDNTYVDAFMNGIPSLLGALITGGGDPHKGTWFNFGPRWGSKGMDQISQIYRSSIDLWKMMGAGPSTMVEQIRSLDPFMNAMTSVADENDDRYFPITGQNILDALTEVSSISAAIKLSASINAGRVLSKKEAYLADSPSLGQAIWSAISGTQDQSIDDLHLYALSLKGKAEYAKVIEEKFVKTFRRGLLSKEDPEMARKFFSQAKSFLTISGLTQEDKTRMIIRAKEQNESLVDSMDFNYFIKRAPEDQKKDYYDAFGRKQRIKDLKQ